MADAKAERETFAEEVHAWMRRLMGEVRVLDASKESKEAAFAAEAVVSADEVDVDELRAGKGADAAAIGRASTSRGASADGGGGGDGAASSTALVGGKEVAQLLAAVDEAERAKNLRALGDLLRPQWEEVAVRAALALASLTAQDEAMQERLAAEGALPKIVGLFDRGFSEKGVLDLTLVVKSLSANCAHHPVLLEQFIGAAGAKKVVSLLSGSPVGALGSGEGQRLTAALEIVRSLSGVKLAREGLVEAVTLAACREQALDLSQVGRGEMGAMRLGCGRGSDPLVALGVILPKGLVPWLAGRRAGEGSSDHPGGRCRRAAIAAGSSVPRGPCGLRLPIGYFFLHHRAIGPEPVPELEPATACRVRFRA